jgi:hypothetical protein
MGFSGLYRRLPLIRDLYRVYDAINHLSNTQQLALAAARAEAAVVLKNADSRTKEPQSLLPFEYSVYSQNGEDGILDEILRRIGVTNRVFCEIGAGNGLENCTVFLLTQGWTGFWFDGSGDFLETLREVTPETRCRVICKVGHLTPENVSHTLESAGVPKDFDVLSIDIDHNTYYIWRALEQFTPRVAVIEYNAIMPSHVDWKVSFSPGACWDRTHNFGASLKALEVLGGQLGYSLVGCDFTGTNAFFVRHELVAEKFSEPFTSEHHYQPYRPWLAEKRHFRTSILDTTN